MSASRAWLVLLLGLLAGCRGGPTGEDGPAPAASNIPRAAPQATGAAYPPPTAFPSTPGAIPPSPQIHDPFGTPPTPPTPFGAGGGGTHL